MSDGLSDHELLMEVRKDVSWLRANHSRFVTRKELYSILGLLITIAAFFAIT